MAEVKEPEAYKVVVIESEKGWGQKIDDIKYFDNEKEAVEFCDTFNASNTADEAPDWYMVAQYEGRVK